MHCMYGAMPNNIIFRCDPSLKAQAERVAKARDETVSQVLRRTLREYVRANAQFEMPKVKKRAARCAVSEDLEFQGVLSKEIARMGQDGRATSSPTWKCARCSFFLCRSWTRYAMPQSMRADYRIC